MRRTLFLLFAAALLAGCDNPVSPSGISVFLLQSIDGAAVPAETFRDASRIERLLSGRLVLNGSTWNETLTYQVEKSGVARPDTVHVVDTGTFSGSQFTGGIYVRTIRDAQVNGDEITWVSEVTGFERVCACERGRFSNTFRYHR